MEGVVYTRAMEFKLWALLLLIADRRGLRKPRPGTKGWVLDAGANDGGTAVMIANALRSLHLNVLDMTKTGTPAELQPPRPEV